MANNIKNAFIDMLQKNSWMDEGTRAKAIEKANKMGFNIAYPDQLTDDTKVDGYFSGLELQPNSLLHSVLNVLKFKRDKQIQDFRQPILKDDWREYGARAIEINAYSYGPLNAVGKFCDKKNHKFNGMKVNELNTLSFSFSY